MLTRNINQQSVVNLLKGLSIDEAFNHIGDNFEKSLITEEEFSKAIDCLINIEKGKKANIGEIRTFSTKKYIKTDKGWRPYTEGGKHHKTYVESKKERVETQIQKRLKLWKDVQPPTDINNINDAVKYLDSCPSSVTQIIIEDQESDINAYKNWSDSMAEIKDILKPLFKNGDENEVLNILQFAYDKFDKDRVKYANIEYEEMGAIR